MEQKRKATTEQENNLFINNVKDAAQCIADRVYLSESNTIVWIFEQSSYHRACRDNGLNIYRMKVPSGGAQPDMGDTVWGREWSWMMGSQRNANDFEEERDQHKSHECRRHENCNGAS